MVAEKPAYDGEDKPGPDPWLERVGVAVGESGRPYAFRPGHLLVRRASWNRLDESERTRLIERIGGRLAERKSERGPVLIEGVDDPPAAAALLQEAGIDSQVNHVFFAQPGDPQAADVSGAPVMLGSVNGTPVMLGGVAGAPVMLGGVGGAPVMLGGVYGVPVMLGSVNGVPVMLGSAGCCCDAGTPTEPPPASPPAPRRNTATASPSVPEADAGTGVCRVVVLDTPLAAERFLPHGLGVAAHHGNRDEPDSDDDATLDAAAGHGTFIASIIQRLAPKATVEVGAVLSPHGDGDDLEVADALWALLADPPQIVNLSFAGYSDDDRVPLAVGEAMAALQDAGVVLVAAAGNDATCRPAWPASVTGVISVGAVGPHGPAWFTNHGRWVRACAPGVEVVARFFGVPDKPTPDEASDVTALGDIVEWASWSGTSFAAPVVAGVLARNMLAGRSGPQAVAAVVDDPLLLRLPGLGTVVNERPW